MKKSTCFVFLIGLLLFANSCQDSVIKSVSDLDLKSGNIKRAAIVDDVKSWFESNPDVNNFFLLEYANPINWENSRVTEVDNSIAVEVKLKLKSKYKLMIEKTPMLNFDQRLLFIKENGSITSYMELFISKRDTGYLQNFDNANYQKKDGSFDGTIVLLDSENEVKQIYQSEEDCQEVKLKSVDETCYELVEIFSDGSSIVIANFGCSGGGGDGSSSTPPSDNGGPSGSAGGGANPGTDPVPPIELSTKFQNNEKVMCIYSNLIRTAAVSFNPLVTTFLANFSDAVTLKPGDIVFDLGALNGAYGQCTPNDDKFEVVLNENEIANRALVEIAKTFMHEILHAQIGHSLQTTWGPFYTMFSDYISMKRGITYTDQHKLMLDNYVEPMINFLRNYDSLNGYSAPYEYYKAIALSGLDFNMTSDEISMLLKAQDYFRNRGINCQ